MFLIWVRNDLRRFFVIEKYIQLVKTVRLSTHIGTLKKNKFKNCFGRGSISHSFQFGIGNLLKNSFLRLEWPWNDFWWCFDHLVKSLILGILSTFKFSRTTLKSSHQDASFKYSNDYIWSDEFFEKVDFGRNSLLSSWS